MKQTKIPYVFNPKRHRRYLLFKKFYKIATVLFTMSCALLLTSAIFSKDATDGHLFLQVSIGSTLVTGLFFWIMYRMMKEERH